MESFREIETALYAVDDNGTNNAPLTEQHHTAEASTEGRPQGVAAPGQWGARVAFDYEGFNRPGFTEWAGNAARYEWRDEYGDVGPRNEELERQLFNVDHISRAGHRLDRLNCYRVDCESETRVQPIASWTDGGLHPVILENIEHCLYDAPTPVQMYSIPAVNMNKDLVAISQTGSGKTGAFLIPILSKLMGKAKKLAAPRPNVAENFDPKTDAVRAEPLVLIVCPTRELATQIFDDARRFCYRSMLRPCVVYGGAPARFQREELQKGCDILVGTPGRIIDFMGQPHVLSLRRVRFTVIDEADELLHNDWEDDFKKIMSGGDANEGADHRYMMFSATFSQECQQLARDHLCHDYIRIRVGRAGSSHLNITQQVVFVDETRKKDALYDLLMSMVPIRTLIFVNSRLQVDYVDDFLYNKGLPSTSIHGGRTQREREDAMRAFKSARCPIMVATGVSARGLDIANIMHVINYDLPKVDTGGITEYVHRIGRTARIGNEGIATSFYNERDEELAPDLVRILMECQQAVPDFLEPFAPSDDVPLFSDETDNRAEDGSARREYGEPETTIIDTGNAQVEEPEPDLEQSAPATDDQWNNGGANSQGMDESQWAPAGNDSW